MVPSLSWSPFPGSKLLCEPGARTTTEHRHLCPDPGVGCGAFALPGHPREGQELRAPVSIGHRHPRTLCWLGQPFSRVTKFLPGAVGSIWSFPEVPRSEPLCSRSSCAETTFSEANGCFAKKSAKPGGTRGERFPSQGIFGQVAINRRHLNSQPRAGVTGSVFNELCGVGCSGQLPLRG